MLTARVNTGIVVDNSVAFMAVVRDRPLTYNNWFAETPSKLEKTSHEITRLGSWRNSPTFGFKIAKISAAPQMRRPTRLILDIDLSTILPKIGQVPNITCTPMRAKWGINGRSLVEFLWIGLTAVSWDYGEVQV